VRPNNYYKPLNLLWLLLLLLLLFIAFMPGIYNYIPETNHVGRVYSFAAILYLQFVLHVMLFPTLIALYLDIGTSRSMCAVPNIAVYYYYYYYYYYLII
jgi:hypothetical protein